MDISNSLTLNHNSTDEIQLVRAFRHGFKSPTNLQLKTNRKIKQGRRRGSTREFTITVGQ